MKINGIEIPEVMNYYHTQPEYDHFVDVMLEQIREELFDFESYDDLAGLIFQFENCTLKLPMGRRKAGDKVECIILNWKDKTLELICDFGTFSLGVFSFKLDSLNGIID